MLIGSMCVVRVDRNGLPTGPRWAATVAHQQTVARDLEPNRCRREVPAHACAHSGPGGGGYSCYVELQLPGVKRIRLRVDAPLRAATNKQTSKQTSKQNDCTRRRPARPPCSAADAFGPRLRPKTTASWECNAGWDAVSGILRHGDTMPGGISLPHDCHAGRGGKNTRT